jgi:hypothetical protein
VQGPEFKPQYCVHTQKRRGGGGHLKGTHPSDDCGYVWGIKDPRDLSVTIKKGTVLLLERLCILAGRLLGFKSWLSCGQNT